MNSARPIVRPMAVSRTFHHGRPSSMSYALFSVLMMAITPAEVLHSVSSMPVVSSPPLPLFGDLLHLLADDVQHVGRGETAERADHLIHHVVDREEARERDQEQQRRKEREEEVVRELGGEAEAVVLQRFLGPCASESLPSRQAPSDWPACVASVTRVRARRGDAAARRRRPRWRVARRKRQVRCVARPRRSIPAADAAAPSARARG